MEQYQPLVVVTGAARGIGLTIVQQLVAHGTTVAMLDVQEEALQTIAGTLSRAHAYAVDLRDRAALATHVAQIERDLGPVTGLVNNAGIVKNQPFLAATDDDWDQVFAINVRAAFVLMQHVGRAMMDRRFGAIVNIASVAGRSARPEQTLYGASKATLMHLTKSAAAAFGPAGVRVNAVCPGVVQTAMTEQIWRERHPDDVASILRSIPLRRTATPAEIASVVTWLLGEGASYINGQAINVCGGLEMD